MTKGSHRQEHLSRTTLRMLVAQNWCGYVYRWTWTFLDSLATCKRNNRGEWCDDCLKKNLAQEMLRSRGFALHAPEL